MQEIPKEKLDKYFAVAEQALSVVKIVDDGKIDWKKAAEEFLDTAQRYVKDAYHFREKGDWVTAFAALNYAHGWLDAGARLGLFDVGHDSNLFSVD